MLHCGKQGNARTVLGEDCLQRSGYGQTVCIALSADTMMTRSLTRDRQTLEVPFVDVANV